MWCVSDRVNRFGKLIDVCISHDLATNKPVIQYQPFPRVANVIQEDLFCRRYCIFEPCDKAKRIYIMNRVRAVVRTVKNLPDPFRSWLICRIKRRNIQMHERKLKLDTTRAALNFFDVWKALESCIELVKDATGCPANRPIELQDRIKIETVFTCAIDDRRSNCTRSLGIDPSRVH